jgi:cob(I)alamin adenosyltransferase
MTGEIGKGYIQIYTGNGKGKTTAALGLCLRAAGHGFNSVVIQFLKGWIDYGELEGVKMLSPYVTLIQSGRDTFVNPDAPDEEDVKLACKGLEIARNTLEKGGIKILVLDEINCAVMFNLIGEEEVLELMRSKPDGIELVLTGRGATKKMKELAHLVTEMREVKHYYSEGVDGRIGVER